MDKISSISTIHEVFGKVTIQTHHRYQLGEIPIRKLVSASHAVDITLPPSGQMRNNNYIIWIKENAQKQVFSISKFSKSLKNSAV